MELNDLSKNGIDTLNQFEREPFKMMVKKEQARSQGLQPINEDVSFMTNLNNIKQGLKQDYSDKEILDMILVNSDFTDKLIGDHLRTTSREKKENSTKFVSRDPKKYRDFVKSTYNSKDQEDPFSHFFIKESGKVERTFKVENEADERYTHFMETTSDIDSKKQMKEHILKSFADKVDDMLLENHRENDDILSLSH